MTIRSELPRDAGAIADVVRLAYATVPYSDRREHLMVERLRNGPAYIRELSLLAEVGGTAVGHILLARASIVEAASAVPTLALAPLSVAPAYQRKGVGRRLVTAAHERAADLGFQSVVLIGIPDYYPQLGYRRIGDYPITLPFDAPAQNCMILELTGGALKGVAGTVRYADVWLKH